MSRPTVSVVIRCFNEEDHIGRLLYGITQQTLEEREIVVVDSGSTDRTLEIVQQFPARVVHIQPEEFTFGRALNLGCSEAKGRFLVFASAHVYPVYEDWLEKLVQPFGNDQIGAVYGKQRGGEQTEYAEQQIFKRLFPEKDIPVQETPFCNNANCAIRRSLWEEVPYNEQLTGLEDLEWGRRIMERGYRISYSAQAEIIHVHDESPSQVKHRYMREAVALKEMYPEQSMSFLDFLVLFIKNTASDYAHALQDRVLLSNVVAIPRFRLMQFWGAYRGFQQHGPVPAQLRRRFYYPREFPTETGDTDYGENEKDAHRIDYRSVSLPSRGR